MKIRRRRIQDIDRSLSSYMNEVNRFPVLTREREIELIRKIEAGDPEAMRELIRSNLRFVISVAKDYQNFGMPIGDLIGEGNFGLMKAASRFDSTKGVRFISYAVYWIRHAIMDALARQSKVTRIPLSRVRVMARMRQEVSKLEQRLGRSPSRSEIAEALGIDTAEVEKLEDFNKPGLSLEAPVFEDEEGSLLDLIPEERVDLEEDLERTIMAESINDSLSALTDRQARILELYYGLNGQKPLTLEEIGEIFGVSRERVRQIKEQAIKKLRHSSRNMELESHLN